MKSRSNTYKNQLFDTNRTATYELSSESAGDQLTRPSSLTAFTGSGFSLGADTATNTNAAAYVSWTFRKAAKFFDVVTYLGNSEAGRAISHSLGTVPGMIVVKASSIAQNWCVWHRSMTSNQDNLYLNSSSKSSSISGTTIYPSFPVLSPTESSFYAGYTSGVGDHTNTNGISYVAYLFAHDPDGVVQCGSYTGNGSTTGPTITLGWEPQYVLIKNATFPANWVIYDNARDTSNPHTHKLYPNLDVAEDSANEDVDFTVSGFQPKTSDVSVNMTAQTYIYLAIKKES